MKKKLDAILLIDDEEATNFLNKQIILKSGITDTIYVKTNGQEALNFLVESDWVDSPKPELIILDINMPIMNGWEFLDEYKYLPTSKKVAAIVMMLTTSINPADIIRAKESGLVNEFKSKPLTLVTLNDIMEKYFTKTI